MTQTQDRTDGAAGENASVPLTKRSPVLSHVRAKLITGMLTAIPLFISLWVLMFIFEKVTWITAFPAAWIVANVLAPLMGGYVSTSTMVLVLSPALALFFSLLIVYLLGLLGTFFVGRRILAALEHFISNLPLIKGIYATTKQVIAVFRQGGGGGFQRVVLVEFPRLGTWTIAFVTNTVTDGTTGERMVCCFIPMTPNPTSGFFQMFNEKQVRNTDWSVDMGIKIVLSGGLLAPAVLQESDGMEAKIAADAVVKDAIVAKGPGEAGGAS